MKLSDLQSKDIITTDGKLIGNIIDVVIENGNIKYIVVEKSKFIISMFSSKDEVEIKWNQIKTIGDDVILVDLT
jgi:YlmC/YmxH family sporulation protein